jgi:hypothetical protein
MILVFPDAIRSSRMGTCDVDLHGLNVLIVIPGHAPYRLTPYVFKSDGLVPAAHAPYATQQAGASRRDS